MNRIIAILMMTLLVVTAGERLCGEDATPAVKAEQLRAGAAEIDVTPPAKGTLLAMRPVRSTGVAEPLFARALVLDDGHQKVAIVTNDYCGFDIPFNQRLLTAIHEATGIPTSHIMINSSHNHSAPLIGSWAPPNSDGPLPWHQQLIDKFAQVVKSASDSLEPARLRFQREPTQLGMNRRLPHAGDIVMAPNPYGNNLPWTDVLSVEQLEGKGRIAALFSYAAHPVLVQRASTLIGGDYPGYTVGRLQKMAQRGGSGGVFMFAQGASGDINAFPLAGGIDAAKTASRDLAYAVQRAIQLPGHAIPSQRLAVAALELQLPLQDPPPVKEIKKQISATTDAARLRWLQGLLKISKSEKRPTLSYPISAVAFGDELCILALPHETFSHYTLFAESVSPFPHNLVMAYTNGVNGYVATRRDYLLGAAGGYEASRFGSAMNYTTRLAPAPESQQIIEEGIEQLYKELRRPNQ
ncbi:MAG: neutral/alkaline non-lysosomal ceramidase N-terminal domain-containing protein [Planctomycetales bacterium]